MRGSVEPGHKPPRRACPVGRVSGEALDQPRLLTPRLEVEEHGEQRGRHEAQRGIRQRQAKSNQDHAPVHGVTHEAEDPALPQTRAGPRSWQGRERTTQREETEDDEEHARDGDQQPENAEERFHRPRPVDADEAAPGDRPAKQELQHDPTLAARTEFGKPRSAGHRQRSSLRPKQHLLLTARAVNYDTATRSLTPWHFTILFRSSGRWRALARPPCAAIDWFAIRLAVSPFVGTATGRSRTRIAVDVLCVK